MTALAEGGFYPGNLSLSLIGVGTGDSRNAQVAPTVNLPEAKTARSPLNWALALTGQRARVCFVGGISGAQIPVYTGSDCPDPRYPGRNNLEAMLASPAGIIYFDGQIANDIGAVANNADEATRNAAADAIWGRLFAMFEAVRKAGKRIIYVAETGSPLLTAPQVAVMVRVLQRARTYLARIPWGAYIETADLVYNLTGGTAQNPLSKKTNPAVSDGGPHWTSYGAHLVGERIAPVLMAWCPPNPKLVRSAFETWANGAVQMNQSPLGTVLGAQPADTNWLTFNTPLPLGMTAVRGLNDANNTGEAKATIGLVDDPRGFGKALSVAATFTAAAEYIQFDMVWDPLLLTTLRAGDRVSGGFACSVAAGSSGATAPWGYTRLRVDGADLTSFDMFNYGSSSAGADYTTAYAYESMTGPITVPDGFAAITQGFQRIRLSASGAGSQTALLSRFTGVREFADQVTRYN
ncbi:hypothetical protein [Sphingomonas sp. 8AM]|uniref:hypothetical protein n=1 Tax=Sphingomonas sp. 8AM TaxID=2653170 RepID=UPI00135852B8|nr:hypothetical protein [Sphingomonas sp. 8AM]